MLINRTIAALDDNKAKKKQKLINEVFFFFNLLLSNLNHISKYNKGRSQPTNPRATAYHTVA